MAALINRSSRMDRHSRLLKFEGVWAFIVFAIVELLDEIFHVASEIGEVRDVVQRPRLEREYVALRLYQFWPMPLIAHFCYSIALHCLECRRCPERCPSLRQVHIPNLEKLPRTSEEFRVVARMKAH